MKRDMGGRDDDAALSWAAISQDAAVTLSLFLIGWPCGCVCVHVVRSTQVLLQKRGGGDDREQLGHHGS